MSRHRTRKLPPLVVSQGTTISRTAPGMPPHPPTPQTKLRSQCRWYFLAVLLLLAAAPLLFSLPGCATFPPESAAAPESRIDYRSPRNWVLRPAPFRPELPVDLFYIYPTVYADPEKEVMEWSDPAVVEKTRQIAGQQCGIFAPFANCYAPFVRQGEISRVLPDLEAEHPDYPHCRTGVEDTLDAFDAYLAGSGERPFILLGHSQGAVDLLELLKRRFHDPALQRRLVAAYLIGAPFTTADTAAYPHLKPAQSADDTGVIVTYNAEAADTPKSLFTGRPGQYAINPLNWRTDATPADRSLNLGARLYDWQSGRAEEFPAFCSAVLKPGTGALVVMPSRAGKYDSELLGPGVYHMNDLYFFYRNLRANAGERLANWQRENTPESAR